MNQSNSESDISMSPTQVLERLQILRQLQLMQRGKLQKQCLQYQETSQNSSGVTEIVSHFTNSTSYNSFRSLLQSPRDAVNEDPSPSKNNLQKQVQEKDLIDGVSVLNLSQESEFVVNSPISSQSSTSISSQKENINRQNSNDKLQKNKSAVNKTLVNKHIALDDTPIPSPIKDFESLILEKLNNDNYSKKETRGMSEKISMTEIKRPFLRRGEGMARFGLKKNCLVIQNTKSLPWKCKFSKPQYIKKSVKTNVVQNDKVKKDIQIRFTEPKEMSINNEKSQLSTHIYDTEIHDQDEIKQNSSTTTDLKNCELHLRKPRNITEERKTNQSLHTNKEKTWAAVLTKEQNDFLHQLKQSEYYKNFGSPAKSTVSDQSNDERREVAEQNMFELLEKKVLNESFNLENSFFNRFLRKNKHECSGESTPLMMQKCLNNNPELLHILPCLNNNRRLGPSQSDIETCNSECTECCSDTCSSVSSYCSCKTVEKVLDSNHSRKQSIEKNKNTKKPKRTSNNNNMDKTEAGNTSENKESENSVTNSEVLNMKANMAEMNAKLITTSELLKDRLCELEDEIETFRKENAYLTKLREEIDLDKQKFYEEKSAYEQKFNEEKVLSEYYLAEEKEKLSKQKQLYERYIREMKGRLTKKEKDEVISLKKQIESQKEEIRIKDIKSTSTIARLRNQIKLMEKEKIDLLNEIEKLKKENRRIQHSNDITRRLTNMKYLADINKKLSNMTSKEIRSEVNVDDFDVKYKAFEIERQSRSKKLQPAMKSSLRPRAKSVPNLNVTSRYARYFSQRDIVSQMEQNKLINVDRLDSSHSDKEESDLEDENEMINSHDMGLENNTSNNDNHLEKLYMETFKSTSKSSLSSTNSYTDKLDRPCEPDDYFLCKKDLNPDSIRTTKSPMQRSKARSSNSPVSILSHRSSNRSPSNSQHSSEFVANSSGGTNNSNRTKSPVSFSNHSTQSQRLETVIANTQHSDRLMVISPEPSNSKTSLTKTNLNPTEIKKPDGSKELKFPNGNVKYVSADGKYSKFMYYNGDVKENFYNEGRIKYFYAETKTFHTTHADGLEVLEFPDGQIEKRYRDGSTEIRLPNGSIRYFDPKNQHVREEWRFPDGTALTISANGDQRVVFSNGQVEVHATDHKRREFPDGTVKLIYNDGTSETRYASGRVRIKDKHGHLLMDSAG